MLHVQPAGGASNTRVRAAFPIQRISPAMCNCRRMRSALQRMCRRLPRAYRFRALRQQLTTSSTSSPSIEVRLSIWQPSAVLSHMHACASGREVVSGVLSKNKVSSLC